MIKVGEMAKLAIISERDPVLIYLGLFSLSKVYPRIYPCFSNYFKLSCSNDKSIVR